MGNGQCARTLHNLLFYLRNFFESIAIVQRQNMQEKWLCEQSRLEINRLYVCIHSTVLIQYFCRGWQKQKQHSTHTNDRNTDLLKIYDLLFLLLSHFARLLLCIVRNKRQNYIELLTSLFCHIFCITFIVVLSNKESETMIAAPDYAYLILFFFYSLDFTLSTGVQWEKKRYATNGIQLGEFF